MSFFFLSFAERLQNLMAKNRYGKRARGRIECLRMRNGVSRFWKALRRKSSTANKSVSCDWVSWPWSEHTWMERLGLDRYPTLAHMIVAYARYGYNLPRFSFWPVGYYKTPRYSLIQSCQKKKKRLKFRVRRGGDWRTDNSRWELAWDGSWLPHLVERNLLTCM